MGVVEALADIVATSSEPALGAIRLAWWREALERLDTTPPPAEPRLRAVADVLLPTGVTGREMSVLEDGFATLMEEQTDWLRVERAGAQLASLAAHLLGADDERLADAGAVALAGRLARLGYRSPSIDALDRLRGHRFARRLRPFTGLARLGARDLRLVGEVEAQATPARAVALLSHRLFGTVA